MKNIKKIFLMVMVLSSPLFSAVIEDAEDGTTNGWIALAGSTVSNETDTDTGSKVIKLSSSIYTYYRMDNLDSTSKKIKLDIKADESFIVYVSLMTTEGVKILYYTTLNRDNGITSSGIHHGIGEAVKDGTWHTVERDLKADLQEFEPSNDIIKITSFKIRAIDDVFLDNIIMLDEPTPTPTPTPTPPTCDASVAIEDAEDGTVSKWVVPAGGTVSNMMDTDTSSKVIKLSSSSYKYYRMDNLNNASTKISWDIKTDKSFIIYVSVMTTDGAKILYYTTVNRDYGVTSGGIHHGLGEAVKDGAWHTVERDLTADLQEFEPSNDIIKITSFKIRTTGDVLLDNIIGCDGSDSGENNPPVANAGNNQTVAMEDEGVEIQLDGSGSSDSDGDMITYTWSFVSQPSGATGTLSDANIVNPTFNADVVGDYVLQLVVNDGQVDSVTDTITVTVTDEGGSSPVPSDIDPTTLVPEFD